MLDVASTGSVPRMMALGLYIQLDRHHARIVRSSCLSSALITGQVARCLVVPSTWIDQYGDLSHVLIDDCH